MCVGEGGRKGFELVNHPRRITYRSRVLSTEERNVMKITRVLEAQRALNDANDWEPPTEIEEPVFLNHGDPGYEDAHFEEQIITRPGLRINF